MRVADFFCGTGGFSEGFRQAGFEICFAVDRWEPAINTYKANKPGCTVLKDDIIRISTLPDEEFHRLIPDAEVIIGSPPCVAFSSSNKSGKGDKEMGINLLKAYLRILSDNKGGYRLPTVREAATMMSFPIDYRFLGVSKGTKHTLVGNAVPPKMA